MPGSVLIRLRTEAEIRCRVGSICYSENQVQRYYPDQGMAYGRSNGAHPADSEGFCIVAGKGVRPGLLTCA